MKPLRRVKADFDAVFCEHLLLDFRVNPTRPGEIRRCDICNLFAIVAFDEVTLHAALPQTFDVRGRMPRDSSND
jgi:hypothetical protein